jgi:hypothetical protein
MVLTNNEQAWAFFLAARKGFPGSCSASMGITAAAYLDLGTLCGEFIIKRSAALLSWEFRAYPTHGMRVQSMSWVCQGSRWEAGEIEGCLYPSNPWLLIPEIQRAILRALASVKQVSL